MIEFLDNFSSFISSIFHYIFIIGFIGIGFHILNKARISIKGKRISLGLIAGIMLFTFGITDLISIWIVQARARVELKAFLKTTKLDR